MIGFTGVPADEGVNTFSTISDSFSTVAVSGRFMLGGLIGRTNYSNVIRSHASGNVTPQLGNFGGLIGYGVGTSVYSSYATGDVMGSNIVGQESSALNVGGLIGQLISQSGQTIRDSFARGNVRGGTNVGGLIGGMTGLDAGFEQGAPFVIERTYAVGDVVGTLSQEEESFWNAFGIGGLIGSGESNSVTGTVHVLNSFATGDVKFVNAWGSYAGGLFGHLYGNGLIANSFATGNVTGSLNGAGAGGLLASSSLIENGVRGIDISNSYATGNVTGRGAIGGLAGNNASGTIIDSRAAGQVTNNGTWPSGSFAGGMAGINSSGGIIQNSYAFGSVTGQLGTMMGGVVGANLEGGQVVNSYYNSDINSGLRTAGNEGSSEGSVIGGGGLNSAQMRDAQFYANGTINQVLANRNAAQQATARALAVQAAASAQQAQAAGVANSISNNAVTSSLTPPDLSASAAGASAAKSAAIEEAVKLVDDAVKADDKRQERERERRRTAQTNRRGHAGSGGGGLGATIRSIDVNGQRFDLQNGAPKPDAPAPAVQ